MMLKSAIPRFLRQNSTGAEKCLWQHLRNRRLAGWKFRRQTPIGPYVVDFVCQEQKLIVEVDGGHHEAQAEDDKLRTAWLESQGFRVIRFWNNEVMTNLDGVIAVILETSEHPHPSPLPSRERKLSPSSPSKADGRDKGESKAEYERSLDDSDSKEEAN